MDGFELRVLGSVDMVAGGQRRPLGAPRQRALLAALALHANEVVSIERIVDSVWGAAPPPSARHVVQTYVSQLRSALEGVATLRTQPPGYMLEIEPEPFCSTSSPAALLDESLALWLGEVAEDVPLEGDARLAARRLEELRLDASELRVDALLALGRHSEVVRDLEQLIAAEPLRERFRAQLMLALYRSGRQSDALAAYRDARRYLADELGVEPGPELRQLERHVLRHDSSLAPPPTLEAEPEDLGGRMCALRGTQ